jgi:hypothetical protein
LKQALLVTLWLFVSACATSQRAEREAALPEGSRQQLDKFRQFMTTRQVEEYLALTDDVARTEYVGGLRIDERLAGYSRPIQDAIWAKDVIKGMDKPAVLLSWGTPREREFSSEGGNEIEQWTYVR